LNIIIRKLPQYESSRRLLKWKNGATAQVFSAEEPERLRGPQFMAAWADEFCVWPKPEAVLANLRLAMRMGNDPRLVVTTTPRPIAALRRLKAEVSCVTTQAATAVNAANLAETFLSGLELLYGGTRLAEQELGGVLVEGDGALWKAEDIARARGAAPAEFNRVVVGVDPPASVDGVCGIVVAGRAGTHGYVLEDVSGAGLSPFAWASRVADAARRWGARAIVAEANQGGDMVRSNLASADVKCPIRLVHASKGKRTRAEPVAALYEQRKVTHCGAFALLEEEMMAVGGSEEGGGEGRVDRADALVWALTALMLEPQPVRPSIEVL
jgi:phage terminase large subunit-like protein